MTTADRVSELRLRRTPFLKASTPSFLMDRPQIKMWRLRLKSIVRMDRKSLTRIMVPALPRALALRLLNQGR